MGGKTSNASKAKYNAKVYDRINIAIPKGQKEIIQVHAAARQESVNAFVGRAISETMERDNAAPAASEGRAEGNSKAGE